MHRPRPGRLDVFETVEISEATVRLRAMGAGYWNEIDRLVVVQIEKFSSNDAVERFAQVLRGAVRHAGTTLAANAASSA